MTHLDHRWHDIVVGDFGRAAVIRYLTAFSDYEQTVLTESVAPDSFFDEHRRVRYTVIGAIREIKSEFIKPFDRSATPYDHRLLVGIDDGIELDDIFDSLVRAIFPFVSVAVGAGATVVRIVIPCNTLAPLCPRLCDTLLAELVRTRKARSGPIPILSVPTVTGAVVDKLVSMQLLEEVFMLGSKTALVEYEKEFRRRNLKTLIRDCLDGSGLTFSDFLSETIQRGPSQYSRLPGKAETNTVSACTDIEIDGTIDSLRVFASRMVADAYAVVHA